MTLHQAQDLARSIGMRIRKTEYGEYRVNFANGAEATAYYTTDLVDAFDTARVMSKQGITNNPTYKKYAGREGSAEFRPMTLEEGKTLRSGESIWFQASDGSARRIKVNGQPKLWKRDPDRIEVPVRYGMYGYGTFRASDFGYGGRALVEL